MASYGTGPARTKRVRQQVNCKSDSDSDRGRVSGRDGHGSDTSALRVQPRRIYFVLAIRHAAALANGLELVRVACRVACSISRTDNRHGKAKSQRNLQQV